MLCVGENLIIADSCFYNYNNCRKLHGFRTSTYNCQQITCFFLKKNAMLQRQLEMWNFFVKEKQKNVAQNEVTFVDTKVDYLKMEDGIVDVKCEVLGKDQKK